MLDTNIFIHVDDGLLFGQSIEILRLIGLLSDQVMMRIVGRLERLGDRISLGRMIVRTALGYSVEANPKYIRDVIALLGLEDSRLVATPSVKRTRTRVSRVEKRVVYRTAVGKLFKEQSAKVSSKIGIARKSKTKTRRKRRTDKKDTMG